MNSQTKLRKIEGYQSVSRSHQKNWLLSFLESTPTVAFIGVVQATGDIRLAGWIGAVSAAAVLFIFTKSRLAQNPIVQGINIHFFAITPLIEAAYFLDFKEQAGFLRVHAESGVLVTVFLVGVLLTIFKKTGFMGFETKNATKPHAFSTALLAVSAFGIVWSFNFEGDRLFAIGLPFMVLFSAKHLLTARLKDRLGNADTGAVLVSAGFVPSEPGPESEAGILG